MLLHGPMVGFGSLRSSGVVGCMLGVAYEKAITYVNDSPNTDTSYAAFMHQILYISKIADRPMDITDT